MKKTAILAAILAASSGYALAQDVPPAAPSTQLSQAECESLWSQANPSNAATITESQAQPYVSDFKAANPDNDGTLDKNEFLQACNNGLVKGSASSGASSGESGTSDSPGKEY